MKIRAICGRKLSQKTATAKLRDPPVLMDSIQNLSTRISMSHKLHKVYPLEISKRLPGCKKMPFASQSNQMKSRIRQNQFMTKARRPKLVKNI